MYQPLNKKRSKVQPRRFYIRFGRHVPPDAVLSSKTLIGQLKHLSKHRDCQSLAGAHLFLDEMPRTRFEVRIFCACRLVSAETVDESILEIANRKLSLDAAVLTDTGKASGDPDSKSMGEILASMLKDPV